MAVALELCRDSRRGRSTERSGVSPRLALLIIVIGVINQLIGELPKVRSRITTEDRITKRKLQKRYHMAKNIRGQKIILP